MNASIRVNQVSSGWSDGVPTLNAKGGVVRFDVNPDAPPGDLFGVLLPIVAERLRNRAAQKSDSAS